MNLTTQLDRRSPFLSTEFIGVWCVHCQYYRFNDRK